MQNMLLSINLLWVVIGLVVGIPLVYYFQLWWWVVTQMLFELTFVFWAIFIAYKKWLLLHRWYALWKLTAGLIVLGLLFEVVISWFVSNVWVLIAMTNISFLLVSYYPIKGVVRWL
jgi:hypothetical protein